MLSDRWLPPSVTMLLNKGDPPGLYHPILSCILSLFSESTENAVEEIFVPPFPFSFLSRAYEFLEFCVYYSLLAFVGLFMVGRDWVTLGGA